MQDLKIQQRINILEIKVFDVITYKEEICNVLDVEPSTGNSKRSHMKSIERFMKLEPIGKGKGLKYKVLEIYDVPTGKTDNRGNNKTYNDKEIHDLMKYYYLVRASQILGVQLDELTNNDKEHDKFIIYNDYWNVFVGVGLCTNNAKNVQAEDLMNDIRFREYDLEVIYYMTDNFFMERQRILRYNSLSSFVDLDRIIIFNDGSSRRTKSFEDEEIDEKLTLALNNYNEEWRTSHKSLMTIPTNRQRKKVMSDKKNMIEIDNYKSDYKGVIIKCHIKSVIEELGLQDLTHDEIVSRYKSLRQHINDECYSHYAKKIHEHFDNERQIQQALEILEYLVKLV